MPNTSSNLPPFSQIAVAGGTPFDSGKGASYLWKHGISSQAIGISERPSQQSELYKNPALVVQKFEEKIGDQDFSEVIIYCNSLSFIAPWKTLYPGKIWELTSYYLDILTTAKLDKLAIIVAEKNTRENLKAFVKREDICDPDQLHVFASLKLINDLEARNENDQLLLLQQTLDFYKNEGYEEILMGCTHLDHPSFSKLEGLKVYQPGLVMLDEFIGEYRKEHSEKKG